METERPTPLPYAAPPKRPLGVARRLLAYAGVMWFGCMLFFAIAFFVFHSLADVPEWPLTAADAVQVGALMVGLGLPGAAVAIEAVWFRR
jgi:hypothetical protein